MELLDTSIGLQWLTVCDDIYNGDECIGGNQTLVWENVVINGIEVSGTWITVCESGVPNQPPPPQQSGVYNYYNMEIE